MSYNSITSESVATQVFRANGDGNDDGTGDFTALRGTNPTQVGTVTFVADRYTSGKRFVTTSNANYLTFSPGTFATTVAFSIACRFEITSSFASVRGLIGVSGTSVSYVRIETGGTTIGVRRGSGTAAVFTVPQLVINTAYDLVVTSDTSNNLRLYLNGTESSSGALAGGTSTMAMATIALQNATTLSGSIGDIRVYNRTLSAAEALEFHNGPEVTFSTGPTITGDLIVGEELTAVSGTLVDPGNGAITSVYDWELDGSGVVHSGTTFTPTEAGTYYLYQTATNTGGDTTQASIEYVVVEASAGSDIKMSMGMGLGLS